MPDAPLDKAQVRATFQHLEDALAQAYWAASTVESKDRIYGIEELVFDVITDLDRAELEAGTPLFAEVLACVRPALEKLDQLRRDIDKVVQSVKVAGEVAGAVDQAVLLATKFFGI